MRKNSNIFHHKYNVKILTFGAKIQTSKFKLTIYVNFVKLVISTILVYLRNFAILKKTAILMIFAIFLVS